MKRAKLTSYLHCTTQKLRVYIPIGGKELTSATDRGDSLIISFCCKRQPTKAPCENRARRERSSGRVGDTEPGALARSLSSSIEHAPRMPKCLHVHRIFLEGHKNGLGFTTVASEEKLWSDVEGTLRLHELTLPGACPGTFQILSALLLSTLSPGGRRAGSVPTRSMPSVWAGTMGGTR